VDSCVSYLVCIGSIEDLGIAVDICIMIYGPGVGFVNSLFRVRIWAFNRPPGVKSLVIEKAARQKLKCQAKVGTYTLQMAASRFHIWAVVCADFFGVG
jgi:hypothetical protein